MKKLKLQKRHKKANSAKGRERVSLILESARDILIEEGFASFSMRKVAHQCEISLGNLSYYYDSKSDLLGDLFDAVIQGYLVDFDEIMKNPDLSIDQKFLLIVKLVMEDLSTRETTHLFPELWARANHDQSAKKAMEHVYRNERDIFIELVNGLNPRLSLDECKIVALFIVSSMEGHTMFIGHKKMWHKWSAETANIAGISFLNMAKSITSAQIKHGLS